MTCRVVFNKKDTTGMLKYVVTIEGHQVVALIDQFGRELSRLYIDRKFCDIYNPNAYNPWKDDPLWHGFHSPKAIAHGAGLQ